MIGELPTTKDGKPDPTKLSSFSPPQDVVDITDQIKQDYAIGWQVNNQSFTEFNDRTLITTMNDNQKLFNSYVEPKSNNPQEQWRWNGVRPIVRNKAISIAAHVTSTVIVPNVFAQNDDDEADQDGARAMRDMLKWNIHNSKYELSFFYGVIAALVNPITYFHVEYAEVYQTIKEKNQQGEVITKDVIDQNFSGIRINVVPGDEILVDNAYENDIQRQRFIIRRRFTSYAEMAAVYGDHKNFVYVNPGVQVLYNEDDGMFYEQVDDDNPTMCEEVIYYNRQDDLEVPFVNGVYMGDDNVYANPIKHRDNKNRPKYCYVSIGYEPIDEGSFYAFKALVSKMEGDGELISLMWRMLMDGIFMELQPPIAVAGGSSERVTSDFMMPGGVAHFDPDTKVTNVGPNRDLMAGINAIREIEASLSEDSASPRTAGQEQKGATTAFEVSRLEENARKQLGLFGKMIKRMAEGVGELMIDLSIHHQTVGEMQEMLSGLQVMKYRKFILPDEIEDGKKITKRLDFTEDLVGLELTEEQKLERSYKILDEQGGLDSNMKLIRVNPHIFSQLSFKVQITADVISFKNERFEKLLKLEAYDKLIQNPFVDQEAVTRDFLLNPLAEGEADKYMNKNAATLPIQPQKKQGMSVAQQALKPEAMAGVMPT